MGVIREYRRYSRHVTTSRRWPAIRAAVLERDGYRCVDCCGGGRLEVDHVQPVRTHPHLSFDLMNLATRCSRCHAKKTRIECGHPPLSEDRQEWRESVLSLAREGKRGMQERKS